jgi:hypothetical protein
MLVTGSSSVSAAARARRAPERTSRSSKLSPVLGTESVRCRNNRSHRSRSDLEREYRLSVPAIKERGNDPWDDGRDVDLMFIGNFARESKAGRSHRVYGTPCRSRGRQRCVQRGLDVLRRPGDDRRDPRPTPQASSATRSAIRSRTPPVRPFNPLIKVMNLAVLLAAGSVVSAVDDGNFALRVVIAVLGVLLLGVAFYYLAHP